VILRTVAGATNIFRSAIRESSIESIVYTSDSFAVLLPEADKAMTVTSADYNDSAISAVQNPYDLEKVKANAWDPTLAIELVTWAAAKAHAEKAVWQFATSHNPTFQIASIIPNMNFGPPIGDLPLSSTGKSIPDLLLNTPNPDLYFPCQYFVNVRDCAKVHVAALLDANQSGKRLFVCAEPFNWNDVLKILRELRPGAEIREDFDGLGRDLSVLPNSDAEELLKKWYGHGWTGLEETVRQNIDGF
jgi:nucleoside-diphosphate-sugar epimerase